jgi:hypothetical protein
MPAATVPEVKNALIALLKHGGESDLAQHWDTICAQAAEYALNEVKGGLLRRGFQLADVAAWDRLYEFTLDLSLWKALILGGAYSGFDGATVQALDRRKELADVLVFVNGVWVQVSAGSPGTVTTAGPSTTNGGVFSYDDTDRNDLGFRW